MKRIKNLSQQPHGIDEHNYYIKTKKRCPKCEDGSKVVHDSELE